MGVVGERRAAKSPGLEDAPGLLLQINSTLLRHPVHLIRPLRGPYRTCGAVGLSEVPLAALVVRLPGSRALHHLEAAALFAPHVMNLHGGFAFRRQVQVLLGQMGPQLSDLKLETVWSWQPDYSRSKVTRGPTARLELDAGHSKDRNSTTRTTQATRMQLKPALSMQTCHSATRRPQQGFSQLDLQR
ncbi:hypothetical protein EYF80_001965 [Liparis tanakae]|uniref:Uncharacterized protein n=1 Tax=Liparis tanakae TaxID=230148 RepID=A0A4Z2JD87_9TELE|nr:hypothetical protein EYF80_001965 [Liparis tanakae]